MLRGIDVLRDEVEIGRANPDGIEPHEPSGEAKDVGGRGRCGEVVVGLAILTLRGLRTGLAGDDERLQLALAERRDRTEGGFDAIRRAVDANGDVVVADSRVADGVHGRDEPVVRSEPYPAVPESICSAADRN